MRIVYDPQDVIETNEGLIFMVSQVNGTQYQGVFLENLKKPNSEVNGNITCYEKDVKGLSKYETKTFLQKHITIQLIKDKENNLIKKVISKGVQALEITELFQLYKEVIGNPYITSPKST